MKNKLIGWSLAMTLGMIGLVSMANAAEQSSEEQSGTAVDANELPYQVVVRGRITKARLRRMIAQVEDDFFDRFNELNIDKAYDVKCYKFTPTMSHIRKRVCEPNFQIKERGLAASEAAFILSCSGACGDAMSRAVLTLYSPKELRRVLRPQYEILQDKLEELTRTDAEFRQIGNVLAELKYRLENF